jgi:ribosomal protein L22
MEKQKKASTSGAPQKNVIKDKSANQEDKKTEEKQDAEKKEPVKEEKKVAPKPKEKRDYAEINSTSLPISTLYAKYICKFIKNKKIDKAIADLEQVMLKKKVVPMKGEIPHKKGEGMMSGRYPSRGSKGFVTALKGLKGNANVNGLNDPVISEAVANIASRPYGRFGRTRKKRTHLRIVAREKKKVNKGNKK